MKPTEKQIAFINQIIDACYVGEGADKVREVIKGYADTNAFPFDTRTNASIWISQHLQGMRGKTKKEVA